MRAQTFEQKLVIAGKIGLAKIAKIRQRGVREHLRVKRVSAIKSKT